MLITEVGTLNENISSDDTLEAIINITQQETGIQKDTIWEKIDKAHPIGKPKQGKQQRIIKFKIDSLKEVVYRKHKNGIKMTRQNQRHDNANVGFRPNTINFKPLSHQKKNQPSWIWRQFWWRYRSCEVCLGWHA